MLSKTLTLTLISLLGLTLAQQDSTTASTTTTVFSPEPTPTSSPQQQPDGDNVSAPTNRGPQRMPGGTDRSRYDVATGSSSQSSGDMSGPPDGGPRNDTDGNGGQHNYTMGFNHTYVMDGNYTMGYNYTLGFNHTMVWNQTCGADGYFSYSVGNLTMPGPPCNGTGPPLPPAKPFSMKCKNRQVGTFVNGEKDGKGKCVDCPTGDASCYAVGNNTRKTKASTCESTHFLNSTSGNCHTCKIGQGNTEGNTASQCMPCDSKFADTCTFTLTSMANSCAINSYLKNGNCAAVAVGEWAPAHNKLTKPNKCGRGVRTCTSATHPTSCLTNYKQGLDSKKIMTCTK